MIDRFAIQAHVNSQWMFVSINAEFLNHAKAFSRLDALILKGYFERRFPELEFRMLERNAIGYWLLYPPAIKNETGICWQKYGF
jgi:hypothetical protein